MSWHQPQIFLTLPSKFSAKCSQTTLWAYHLCVSPVPSAPSCQDPPPSGKAQWGFPLIISSSGTYDHISAASSEKPHRGLSTQLSPWALGSKRAQSLGEKRPQALLLYSFLDNLHPDPISSAFGWWRPSHHLLGRRQSRGPTSRWVLSVILVEFPSPQTRLLFSRSVMSDSS